MSKLTLNKNEIRRNRKFMRNTCKYQAMLIGLECLKMKFVFYKGLYGVKILRLIVGWFLKRKVAEKRSEIKRYEGYKKYPETLFGVPRFNSY